MSRTIEIHEIRAEETIANEASFQFRAAPGEQERRGHQPNGRRQARHEDADRADSHEHDAGTGINTAAQATSLRQRHGG